MSEDLHARAQRLLAESVVEGLAAGNETWLREHLRNCAECARYAEASREILRALRAVPAIVPRDLAARTQLRVRLRAQEASSTAIGTFWLWVVTALSWLLGVFSAPLVWKGFAWLGNSFGVPKLALEMGFVLWWTVPALFAVGIVLYQRAFSARAKGI